MMPPTQYVVVPDGTDRHAAVIDIDSPITDRVVADGLCEPEALDLVWTLTRFGDDL